ncbi:unnamed protein product [Eretmochelys imbricata]
MGCFFHCNSSELFLSAEDLWSCPALQNLAGKGVLSRIESYPKEIQMGLIFSRPPGPRPLSVESLLRVRSCLESQGKMTNELRSLFDKVLWVFPQECMGVQENAKVVIQSRSDILEFISGKGECVFTFFTIDSQPHYNLRKPASFLTQLRRDPEPLSTMHLLRMRSNLETQGQMTDELRSCMDLALNEYLQEPKFVQENARMVIQSRGKLLEFSSGRGECQICVFFFANRGAQYDLTASQLIAVARMLNRRRATILNLILQWMRPSIPNLIQLIWETNWRW